MATSKDCKKSIFSKQVHYQFVSGPYMEVHITTGGCLGDPTLKKLEDH